jgi:hypothetical protein
MKLVAALVACGLLACSSKSAPAAQPDAHADAWSGSAFACGSAACDPSAQYCFQSAAGVTGATGAAPVVGCNALPTACAASPSCTCVTANVDLSGCASHTCADGSGLVVTCDNP